MPKLVGSPFGTYKKVLRMDLGDFLTWGPYGYARSRVPVHSFSQNLAQKARNSGCCQAVKV